MVSIKIAGAGDDPVFKQSVINPVATAITPPLRPPASEKAPPPLAVPHFTAWWPRYKGVNNLANVNAQ